MDDYLDEGGAASHTGFSGTVAHSHIAPDVDRVIIHFDVDCFYAQVEEIRNPSLKGKPLGVTQKYIIVTSNYAARSRGVTKLMGIKDAQTVCPDINLVSGEDLTPYRQASKAIWSLLQRFGPVQRGGMDEAFVDVTTEVKKRIAANSGVLQSTYPWHGHVWSRHEALVQDSKHRPQDLRVLNPAGQQASSTPVATSHSIRFQNAAVAGDEDDDDDDALFELVLQTERVIASQRSPMTAQHSPGVPADNSMSHAATLRNNSPAGHNVSGLVSIETLLRVGSAVALEARQLIAHTAGYRTSAGVGCNKLLAKLVSGLHKPDDQTMMLPVAAAEFVAELPVMSLPGVGCKMNQQLREMGVTTVQQLRTFTEAQLVRTFGATNGHMLAQNALGKDDIAVMASGVPKSITCEDSFKSCSSFDAVATVVNVVAPDLAARVVEEFKENQRWPKTMTIKWRFRADGFKRSGASTPLPPEARPGSSFKQLDTCMVNTAMTLLKSHLQPPFDLTLINLGVTSFQDHSAPKNLPKISSFFKSCNPTNSAPPSPHHPTSNSAEPTPECTADAAPVGARKAVTRAPTKRVRDSGSGAQDIDGKKLCAARRDYKSTARTNVLSKRAERALMDTQAGLLPSTIIASNAVSADAKGCPELESPRVDSGVCKGDTCATRNGEGEVDEAIDASGNVLSVAEVAASGTVGAGGVVLERLMEERQNACDIDPRLGRVRPVPSQRDLRAQISPADALTESTHPTTDSSSFRAAAFMHGVHELGQRHVGAHNQAPQLRGGGNANATPASWGSDSYSPPKVHDFSVLPGVLAYGVVEEEDAQTDTTMSTLPSQHMHEHNAQTPSSQRLPIPENSCLATAMHAPHAHAPEAHACITAEPSAAVAVDLSTDKVGTQPLDGARVAIPKMNGTWNNESYRVCSKEVSEIGGKATRKRAVVRLPSLKGVLGKRSSSSVSLPGANGSRAVADSVAKGDQKIAPPGGSSVKDFQPAVGTDATKESRNALLEPVADCSTTGAEACEVGVVADVAHHTAATAIVCSACETPAPAEPGAQIEFADQPQHSNACRPSSQPNAALDDNSVRVILLLRPDSFFCQVEVKDNPELAGHPIVVQSSPGSPLVACSPEAQACGLHATGGPVTQSDITSKCPNLVLRAPRHYQYVKESKRLRTSLQNLLKGSAHPSEHANGTSAPAVFAAPGYGTGCSVEASDSESFYFDVTAACMHQQAPKAALDSTTEPSVGASADEQLHDALLKCCHLVGQADAERFFHKSTKTVQEEASVQQGACTKPGVATPKWSEVPQDLLEGCRIAVRLKQYIRSIHGYHASVGVSRTRLVSRLLAPISVRGVTALPSFLMHAFMACVPLSRIPALAGKAGAELQQTLSIESVGELAMFSEDALADKFGAARARMLRALLEGGCDGGVKDQEEGGVQEGQGSVVEEKSYQLADRPESMDAAVRPLVQRLMSRLVHCSATQKRLPTKFALEWRQGVDATKLKTFPIPTRVCARLRSLLVADGDTHDANVATGADAAMSTLETTSLAAAGLDMSDDDPEQSVVGLQNTVCSADKAAVNATDMHASAVEAIVTAVCSLIGASVHSARSIARISICATFEDNTSATSGISQQRLHTFLASPSESNKSPSKTPPKPPFKASKLRTFFQSRFQQSPSKHSTSTSSAPQPHPALKTFSLSEQQDSPAKRTIVTSPVPSTTSPDNTNPSTTAVQNHNTCTSPHESPLHIHNIASHKAKTQLPSPLKSCMQSPTTLKPQSLTAKLAQQLSPHHPPCVAGTLASDSQGHKASEVARAAHQKTPRKSVTQLKDFEVSVQRVQHCSSVKDASSIQGTSPVHLSDVPTEAALRSVASLDVEECTSAERTGEVANGGVSTACVSHHAIGGCTSGHAAEDLEAKAEPPGGSVSLTAGILEVRDVKELVAQGSDVPHACESHGALLATRADAVPKPRKELIATPIDVEHGDPVDNLLSSVRGRSAVTAGKQQQERKEPQGSTQEALKNVLQVYDDDNAALHVVVAEGCSKPDANMIAHRKVLQHAVSDGLRGAAKQGVLDLDERLALRMQEEELASAPKVKAGGSKDELRNSECAGPAPTPNSRNSLKRTSTKATATKKPQKARASTGSMKQLESFFGAPCRTKK